MRRCAARQSDRPLASSARVLLRRGLRSRQKQVVSDRRFRKVEQGLCWGRSATFESFAPTEPRGAASASASLREDRQGRRGGWRRSGPVRRHRVPRTAARREPWRSARARARARATRRTRGTPPARPPRAAPRATPPPRPPPEATSFARGRRRGRERSRRPHTRHHTRQHRPPACISAPA